jgi:hypothetical protein
LSFEALPDEGPYFEVFSFEALKGSGLYLKVFKFEVLKGIFAFEVVRVKDPRLMIKIK